MILTEMLEQVGFSFQKILQYYAMLNLTLTPLSLILMVYLARRTNLLDKVDKIVDKIIPERPEQTPGETIQPTQTEKQYIEGLDAMSGIASFKILVGENYQCHLNYQNRGGSFGGMVWFNDNDFVGEIREDGLFKSKKAGTAKIYCTSKGHAYESGVQAYSIQVIPKDDNWFVDRIIEAISERVPRADMKVKNLRRKILRENLEKRTVTYVGLPAEGTVSLALQYDKLDTLERAVYCFQNNEKNRKKIHANLMDRFEKLKLQKAGPLQLWIHQIIDTDHQEVDIYAIIAENGEELYLGIGQNWREYGEKEEFIDNIRLAGRQFADLVPVRFPDEIKAVKEEENRVEEEEEIVRNNPEGDVLNEIGTEPEQKEPLVEEPEETTAPEEQIEEPEPEPETEEGTIEETDVDFNEGEQDDVFVDMTDEMEGIMDEE